MCPTICMDESRHESTCYHATGDWDRNLQLFQSGEMCQIYQIYKISGPIPIPYLPACKRTSHTKRGASSRFSWEPPWGWGRLTPCSQRPMSSVQRVWTSPWVGYRRMGGPKLKPSYEDSPCCHVVPSRIMGPSWR